MSDWETEDPELAKEVGTRVLAGLLKLAKTFVPTYDGQDGKKAHRRVPILDGTLYIGSDQANYMAAVSIHPSQMCKKKSAVRDAMGTVEGSLCTSVHYGSANAWLKLHAKNARYAAVGGRGILLGISRRSVEIDLPLLPADRDYAEKVRDTISSRIADRPTAGPFPFPDFPEEEADTAVLTVGPEGASASTEILVGCRDGVQMVFKPKGIVKSPSMQCAAYDDPLGRKIIMLMAESPEFSAKIYYRVLEI
jgi:hypothetical protein